MALLSTELTLSDLLVQQFLRATGDTNPLHKQFAPGLQTLLLLEALARQNYDGRTNCITVCAEFPSWVPVGAQIRSQILTADPTQTTAALYTKTTQTDKPAVLVTFTHVNHTNVPDSNCSRLETVTSQTTADSQTFTYQLDSSCALQAGESLGKTEPDYRALAIGLASKALLGIGEKIGLDFAKQVPLYSKQTFVLLPALYDLEKMQPAINLRAALCSRALREYTAVLLATAQGSSTPLYAAQLDLKLVSLKALERASARLPRQPS